MVRTMSAVFLLASIFVTGCDCGCVVGPAIVSGAAAGVGGALTNELIQKSK